MADPNRRRPENIGGNLFVDDTCIDCDTCRWMAPDVFDRAGSMSRVHRQPRTAAERSAAFGALLACPTTSIGSIDRGDITAEVRSFPRPIHDDVFHCGFHAEATFGATSYFVQRSAGNVLIDVPRFAAPLVRRIEELGGLDWIFLTHSDDVGDHAQWAEAFGARRILHAGDIGPATADVEWQVEGDEPVVVDEDITLIPVPGHTRGSMALLYRRRDLFSGDHVAWSPSLEHVYAFRKHCFHSWSVQIASMQRLAAEHRFEWILPGHGRRCQLAPGTSRAALDTCVEWMRGMT